MKIWPFGKDHNIPKMESGGEELARVESSAIVLTLSGSSFDIELYEHASFDEDVIGKTAFVDAVIPAAGAVVDAVAQYGHAIVRFPEGANWGDLLNRKTPGWEGFKQLGILKDGKFQPQAAIKQAKLQPAAIGNLALQGAAMVVGQMYMVEINKQLEEVTSGISAIQEEMRLDRESKIAASMEMLKEYSKDYMIISDDPMRLQAVITQIESIREKARDAWIFQVSMLQSMEKSLRKDGKLKEGALKKRMVEFAQREKAAHDAFVFLMAAEQVGMQYRQNYSAEQIAKEREYIQARMAEYDEARNAVQGQLNKAIDKLQGGFLAVPDAAENADESLNPLVGFIQNAPNYFPANMREEAKRQGENKKAKFKKYVFRENPIIGTADSRVANLDNIDFIYNQANVLLIDRNGIHFLRDASSNEGEDDKTEL
ncbi:hypothetical protein [Adlercreutzia equolifaciens]|uniref:hypothetical protein n=1 Tax=Adlercreutzia equolifaciens TaxID=446660 RepID=UPI003A8D9357